MQIFLARIVIAYNRSKILRVLLSYDRDFFFSSFLFCLTHFYLTARYIGVIRNIIIYNYDFVLVTLFVSFSYVMILILNNIVFELIIFFWQLKVIRSLNLIVDQRYLSILQFRSFTIFISSFNNIYNKRKIISKF